MKKILIFSTAYFPFVGGAEVAVKELTDRLGDEIEFDMLTAKLGRGLPPTERIGKVNVYRIGVGIPLVDKLLVPFVGAAKALRLHKKHRYDAYWCIMASFASGAAFIANWFQKKVPIILTLQEGDSETHINFKRFGLIGLSWRLALRQADILTAISHYLIRRGRQLGFRGEAFLIPNGVDVNKFSIFNFQFPKHPPEIRLITTSRLVEKNGIKDLIEAMTHLPEQVRLQIIGTGPLESELKHHAEMLNVASRIDFAGEVSHSEIPMYLSEADIFVRPSLSEGMGNSFIEAMAAGLPVIATPVGGIPDFLADGETGVFCKPGDPQSLAAAVERLRGDAALRGKLTTNALHMVRERYDWDLIAEKLKTQVFAKV